MEWATGDGDGEQCEGRVKNEVFSKKRIPIAGTKYWDQDKTYLDLDPGPRGVAGQVITLVTECDFEVLGESSRGEGGFGSTGR